MRLICVWACLRADICARACSGSVRKCVRACGLKRTRRPQAGRWMGRSRRPRRRSPRSPRGYDPTPPAGGPVLGRARLMPVGAGTTKHTCTQSVLNSSAPGPAGRAGRRPALLLFCPPPRCLFLLRAPSRQLFLKTVRQAACAHIDMYGR